MTSKSKNNIRIQKKLSGYVVLLGERAHPLAINFGPTILGRMWNFDWLGRATVFKTKRAAQKIIKEYVVAEEQKRTKIVPLKEVAVLIPEVNARLKVFYRVEPKTYVKPISERINKYLTAATELEKEAQQALKDAQINRQKAQILQGLK